MPGASLGASSLIPEFEESFVMARRPSAVEIRLQSQLSIGLAYPARLKARFREGLKYEYC
jgi:hypothetical protein